MSNLLTFRKRQVANKLTTRFCPPRGTK